MRVHYYGDLFVGHGVICNFKVLITGLVTFKHCQKTESQLVALCAGLPEAQVRADPTDGGGIGQEPLQAGSYRT